MDSPSVSAAPLHVACHPFDNTLVDLLPPLAAGHVSWQVQVFADGATTPSGWALVSGPSTSLQHAEAVHRLAARVLGPQVARLTTLLPFEPGDPHDVVLRMRCGTLPDSDDVYWQLCTETALDAFEDDLADAARWATWQTVWPAFTVRETADRARPSVDGR